jgi:hypothetical protein
VLLYSHFTLTACILPVIKNERDGEIAVPRKAFPSTGLFCHQYEQTVRQQTIGFLFAVLDFAHQHGAGAAAGLAG